MKRKKYFVFSSALLATSWTNWAVQKQYPATNESCVFYGLRGFRCHIFIYAFKRGLITISHTAWHYSNYFQLQVIYSTCVVAYPKNIISFDKVQYN